MNTRFVDHAYFPRRGITALSFVLFGMLLQIRTTEAALFDPPSEKQVKPEASPPDESEADDADLPPDRPPAFGPGPRPGPGGPPWLGERFGKGERERVQAFVKEHFPNLHEELEQLRDRRKELYEKRFRRVLPEVHELMDMLEINPERAKLFIQERRIDMDMRRLGARYRNTVDESEKAKILEQMRTLGQSAFDARQEREAFEIREIETRLQELKERHVRAPQDREKLVEKHVQKRIAAPPIDEKGGPGFGERRPPRREPGPERDPE